MQKVFLGGISICIDLFRLIGRSQQGFLQEGPLDSCRKLTCLAVPQIFLVLFQMLVSILLYQRFVEDKIHQFIDLCSLSNVSHTHTPKVNTSGQIVCLPTWPIPDVGT